MAPLTSECNPSLLVLRTAATDAGARPFGRRKATRYRVRSLSDGVKRLTSTDRLDRQKRYTQNRE